MDRNNPSDRAIGPEAPKWISNELIEQTLRVWQPYYQIALTRADAVTMLLNVGRMFNVLSQGSKA